MRRARRVLVLGLAVIPLVLAGCSSVPFGPAYTSDELAWQCQRSGGVWRSFVGDGYCEYQGPGFL
jgi:hypothetical protein